MSRLVAKILLTVLIFPSATLVLFVSFFFFNSLIWRRENDSFSAASILTALYIAVYWLALWWRSVQWSVARTQLTLLCGIFSLAVGGIIGTLIANLRDMGRNVWLGVMFGGLTVPVAWITGTIFIWRETREERAARVSRAGADAVVCPACGYNLTGLSEARCPECGAMFTLNELLAGQPSRAGAEIEN
jgi:hypothetical protein